MSTVVKYLILYARCGFLDTFIGPSAERIIEDIYDVQCKMWRKMTRGEQARVHKYASYIDLIQKKVEDSWLIKLLFGTQK